MPSSPALSGYGGSGGNGMLIWKTAPESLLHASEDKPNMKTNPTVKPTTTHVIRVSLDSHLYRDIEIDSADTLYGLAYAINLAFGFDFHEHVFGFFSKLTGSIYNSPERYELATDEFGDSASRSVDDATVGEVFRRIGKKMTYVFDYGAQWRFRVEFISRREKALDASYPRIVATVGKAPVQYAGTDEEE